MLHLNNHERPGSRNRNNVNHCLRALNVHPQRTAVSEVNSISLRNVEHHDAIHEGRVAVITGAASGIGLAAARQFASVGMKLAIADRNEASLKQVREELTKTLGDQNIVSAVCDVSKLEDVQRLKDIVYDTWGEVSVLMNNAGISLPTGSFKELDNWHKTFATDLFGVVNVQQTFVPHMIWQENQCLIINTGSKQGITNPPGNPAYNAAKAAVKSLTESLAFELRQTNTKLTAHLFIPGWTYTGLSTSETKPDGAWTPDETISYMLRRVKAGHFYIVCPDNEVVPGVDHLRIMWGAADIVEGRPALSRWHPDYKGEFEEFIRDGLAEIHTLHNASRSRPGSVFGDNPNTSQDNL